jgi:hypothetical protein
MQLTQRLWAIATAGFLAVSVSAAAIAQQGAKPPRGAVPQVFLNKLMLTAEQKGKVKAATDQLQTELTAANALTTPKEKRQATNKARKSYETAVNGALTEEQQKQLQAMKDEAKQFAGMGQIGNQMVGLNLSDEQKTKINQIRAKHQPELEKLRAELKGASDKKSLQDQIKQVNTKMADEVKAVLTADQLKQLPGRKKQQ